MSRRGTESSSILGSSAVMAAGTVFSRISGFVRSALLVAALGSQLHADVFNIANTVPNSLYILLAGGVFNAVLVPQLVRAMKNHPDGGEAYTSRIITLAAVFLTVVTALMVVGAPWLMRLFLSDSYYTPKLSAQLESTITFARYCLPQVFFYGMFVLLGQVLNARGRFGPMMWAPIANNVISVAVLGAYLGVFGKVSDAQSTAAYSSSQELLLGLGATFGIVVQFLILLPYLRAAGFSYRPRFDFRGTGLGHTLRLGIWTVLFVIVNQVAYAITVRIASSGTAEAVTGGGSPTGTGYTVFNNAYLLMMVPHSVITVSLVTAVLPRLSADAADADLAGVSRNVAATLRTTLTAMVPVALLLPLVALPLSNLAFGYGAGSDSYGVFATSLALFAPGMVVFTSHYLLLRGFYALERTRTVFWIQCVVGVVNVALAVALTSPDRPAQTAPGLVLAFGGAYLVGAVVSYSVLRGALGRLETTRLAPFLARLVVAALVAAAVAWAAKQGLEWLWAPGGGKLQALVTLAVVGGVDVAAFVVAARVLRIAEVSEVLDLVTRRLRR